MNTTAVGAIASHDTGINFEVEQPKPKLRPLENLGVGFSGHIAESVFELTRGTPYRRFIEFPRGNHGAD